MRESLGGTPVKHAPGQGNQSNCLRQPLPSCCESERDVFLFSIMKFYDQHSLVHIHIRTCVCGTAFVGHCLNYWFRPGRGQRRPGFLAMKSIGWEWGCSNFTSYGSHKDNFIQFLHLGVEICITILHLKFISSTTCLECIHLWRMTLTMWIRCFKIIVHWARARVQVLGHGGMDCGAVSFGWNAELLAILNCCSFKNCYSFLILRNLLKDFVPGTDIVSLVRTLLLQGEPSVWNVTS